MLQRNKDQGLDGDGPDRRYPCMTQQRVAAIIVAAGRGLRMGSALPKQYSPLAGRPVLRWTVDALRAHPEVRTLAVVINPDDHDHAVAALAGVANVVFVPGGATRQASVRAGLEALASDPPETVLIHDAARPLVDIVTIGHVIAALTNTEGAIAAHPVSDTLKSAKAGYIEGTVPREGLWRAQTPQGFRFASILAAHRAYADADLTDDAALAERAGMRVAIVPSPSANLKLTTPEDLHMAEALLSARLGDMRTGFGFDVHRFGPGDHVWLCGVKVPHRFGLVGHSDADVGLHAVTDAILGAVGAGDIGMHFPPSDPQWKGAPSDRFLAHAVALVRKKNGVVAHVDVTVICETPKVGPWREAMQSRIADIIGLDRDRVSIKATTTEGLGFTGRAEGIAVQAVATIRLPS